MFNRRLKRSLAALLATAALSVTQTALAETWQVLLPSTDPEVEVPGSSGVGLLADPFSDSATPGVFLGLNTYGSGEHSIIKISSNPLADPPFSRVVIAEVDNALIYVTAILHAPNGELFAFGRGRQDPKAKNSAVVWRTRKSLDQGQTWVDDDKFSLAKNSSGTANEAAVGHGYIYASGLASSGRTPYWVVRRKPISSSPSSSLDWTTVLSQEAHDVNTVPKVCFFPGNATALKAVLTAGVINSRWTVLRSQQDGAPGTWQTVDTWPDPTAEPFAESNPFSMALDQSGNIYVVGCRGINGRNPSGWVVRKSSDGGMSWTTLVDVPTGTGNWASSIAFRADNTVWLSGVSNTGDGPRWTVLRNHADPLQPQPWQDSVDGSDSWSQRVLPFGSSNWSKGGRIVVDLSGNLFLGGEVADWVDDGTKFPGQRATVLRVTP